MTERQDTNKQTSRNGVLNRAENVARERPEPDMLNNAHDELERRVVERTEALRKANADLEAQLRFEILIVDLSARFINLSFDQIDSEIEYGLKQVLDTFKLDRCGLFEAFPEKNEAYLRHIVLAEGIAPVPIGVNLFPGYPWIANRLFAGRTVADSMDNLPIEATIDKKSAAQMGWRFGVHIPLSIDKAVRYLISMHSADSKEFTSPEFISRFQLLGEIIVAATERLKAARSLRESEKRYRIVVDFTYDWEYWAHFDGTLKYRGFLITSKSVRKNRNEVKIHRGIAMHYIRFLIMVTLGILVGGNFTYAQAKTKSEVRLVLQITIDGLRADLINRYRKGFGTGGFRLLLENGAYYTNAHYQYANTETIVGHATLATGAFPSQHGMVGNVWFDREAGELAYNIEDPNHPILPTREHETKGEQVDPAQKKSRTRGRSPAVILVPALGDGLAADYGGRSKIFGVSGKDRSAVSMAGHVGKAFWYSTNTGDFVTSTYYYDAYPEWVRKWNAQRKAKQFAGSSWTLLNDISTYLLAAQDDRPYEVDLKGYGRVFPHPFGQADDKLFCTRILVSPIGDQLTLDFSKVLITQEQLGRDEIPDYLSISFSGVDAVNHFFGASSLENEDVVVQLDRRGVITLTCRSSLWRRPSMHKRSIVSSIPWMWPRQ
jgi:hypothetical protein